MTRQAGSKLRVLMVSTTYPRYEGDHTPRFVADLCEHLVAEHNAEVTMLAPHGPGLEEVENLRGVRVKRFRYALDPERQAIAYGAGVTDNLRDIPRARWQLPGFLTAMLAATLRHLPHCDLVHAHWAQTGAIVGLANMLRGRRPLLLTMYRVSVPVGRLERFAMSRAARVLFISRFTLELTKQQLPSCRGEVAYLGFDQESFQSSAGAGDGMRERLQIPADAPIVAGVARLVSFKGFTFLLEAAEQFLAQHTDAHLVIAGDGPEGDNLRRQAAASAFSQRIHLPGALERGEVVQLFAAADLFVNPSIHRANGFVETLGVVTLEAAAMGVPAVGTRVGGIPETIVHGDTGLLVPDSDPQALAEAIGGLLDDPERRKRYGEAARRRVQEEFSWRRLASKVHGIYGQVLAGQ